ncbi:MAG: spore coat protein CotJB [Lachnospiraceae bacterium]|nr:spore coat protein CotJB [Lachnospiraceae bacterium]MBR3598491.1 spore coat protein CotJB [Lachnospiraceae bacterium]
MNQMGKSELFCYINQVSFMIDDIALFLNTHPNCQQALDKYNYYKDIRKEAVETYTKLYGPICKYDVNVDNYWDWVNKPWPWEGECGR